MHHNKILRNLFLTVIFGLFTMPSCARALTVAEFYTASPVQILGQSVYSTFQISKTASFDVKVMPLNYQNGRWNYQIQWTRTLNKQGSFYLTLKSNKSETAFKMDTAAKQGTVETGFLLKPNTAYRFEFYAQPNAKSTLLIRKFFTTLKALQVACTQEAKLCPDGSSVSRQGPSCEFAACPPVSCMSRPACLDATPRCLMAEPAGGWCPAQQPRVGQLINKNGTVFLVGNDGLYGVPSLAVFNSWGWSFSQAVTANPAEAALAQIDTVPSRDPACSDVFSQINGICGSSLISGGVQEENVVFILPQAWTVGTDYQSRVQTLLDRINSIYAKNTLKKFKLQGIKSYDMSKCVPIASEASQLCFAEVVANKDFYLPKSLSIFYVPFTDLPHAIFTPGFGVAYSISQTDGIEALNPANINQDIILVHEIGHTFGLGFPELYAYLLSDTTQAPPLTDQTNFLPKEYYNDPMAMMQPDYSKNVFGPLDQFVINLNLDHSLSLDLSGFFTKLKYYPKAVTVLASSATGQALSQAQVKVYCINTASSSSTKEHVFSSDSSGIALVQEVIKGIDGMPASKNKGILDNFCSTSLIKVYKDGYQPAVVPMTAIQLQEAKMLNKVDNYIINVTLKASTDIF